MFRFYNYILISFKNYFLTESPKHHLAHEPKILFSPARPISNAVLTSRTHGTQLLYNRVRMAEIYRPLTMGP